MRRVRLGVLGPLALAALVAAGASASPLQAQRGQGGARGCEGSDCEAMRDYLAELSKLRAEVAALSRQQARLQASQKRGDEAETLENQLRYATRKLARLQSRLSKDKDADSRAESAALIQQLDQQLRQLAERQSRQAQELVRTPRAQLAPRGQQGAPVVTGWVGLVTTSQGTQIVRNNDIVINFADYPVVESVEPGSPAEKARVSSGDTIVAYNRRDVRNRDISLSALFKPGSVVYMTLKRDGRLRTVPVIVADRSENPELDWSSGATPAAPAAPPQPARVRVAPPAQAPVAAIAPSQALTRVGSTGVRVVGAEFVRMNDDLREVFDVRGGVLVYSVGANTPAAQSGLRGGDVVVSADDQRIESPGDLERVVNRDSDRSLKLTIVRKRREQAIHLKW